MIPPTDDSPEQLRAEIQRLQEQIAVLAACAEAPSHSAEFALQAPPIWFNAISDAVIVTDASRHIQQWNHAAEHIYGWTATAMIGQSVSDVLPIVRYIDLALLDLNESLLHLIGYTRDEIVGLSWRTLAIFGDRDVMSEMALQVRTTGRVQNQQAILRTKQGELRTILFSCEPLVLDNQDCFISTCVDITERVYAQELLRRTADRLATMRAIDQAILKLHAPTTIANAVVANMDTLIPCQYASVMLYDPITASGQLLTVRSDLPRSMPTGMQFPLPLDDFPIGFRHGMPWVEHNLQNAEQATPIPAIVAVIATSQIHSLISIPLLIEWNLIGTLNLAATLPGVFTDEHITIAQEIGDMLSIALHNARLIESFQQELAARMRAEVALTAEHERVVRLG